MNIFALHLNPRISANWLCDKHLGKMLLESSQMIVNCFPDDLLVYAPKTQKGTTRKYSYYNHPCSKWVRKTKHNLNWLIIHSFAISELRMKLGLKHHFSMSVIEWAENNIDKSITPDGGLTEFAIAIAEDKNCRKVDGFERLDPTIKYRLYYKMDKPFAEWKNREIPYWMKWGSNEIIEKS